jgi:hypothetical protein
MRRSPVSCDPCSEQRQHALLHICRDRRHPRCAFQHQIDCPIGHVEEGRRRSQAEHARPGAQEGELVSFALLTLLVVQWMLSSAIQGTNYDGDDGKMAQATILAAVLFKVFQGEHRNGYVELWISTLLVASIGSEMSLPIPVRCPRHIACS